MRLLKVNPGIYKFDTFADFVKDFEVSEDDLIFTNEYIYNPTISATGVKCKTVFEEKYGAGEPTDIIINGVLADTNRMSFDRIIAVGGGTIIDIAKVLAVADGLDDVNDLYDHPEKIERKHDLIILPTTCGTGSEVTNLSIINRTKLGVKQGLASDNMCASQAVFISEFMNTLPYGVFATSSIDALIHAIESYLSPLATSFSRMFSVEAIKDILEGYKKVALDRSAYQKEGDRFLIAADYAGIAFNEAGCATVHAVSYALGGKYHVPHGESNYEFLMAVLYFYKEKNPDGQIKNLEALLSDILGCGDGLKGLEDILEKILPHKKMSEYGATQEDIKIFAEATFKNQTRLLSKSYVKLTQEDIEYLFRVCL